MQKTRILIADDNPSIHLDFKKILSQSKESQRLENVQAALLGKSVKKEKFNFVMDFAYQGEDALNLVRTALKNNRHYALAFVDVRMPPGIDGIETAKLIWELDPEVQIVICTAYSDYSWEDLSKKLGLTDRLLILKKPFENIEVRQFASALTKKWHMAQQLQQHLTHLEELVENRTHNLAKSFAVVKATLEATSDGILVVDTEQNIEDYNHKFLKIFEIQRAIIHTSTAKSTSHFVLNQLENPKIFLAKTKDAYEHPELELHDILDFKDGRTVEYFSAPQYIGKEIIGRVFSFRDITEQKKLEKQLQHQATHDTLTGLSNRVVLFDRIQQAVSAAKRSKRMVAILFIDLDYFKLINDTLGYEIGDEVLKTISKCIQKCITENNTLARIGGDEFVIIMPFLEKIDPIISLCQKLLEKISESFQIKNTTLTLTASIGISLYPKDGKHAKILLKNANIASYSAKEMGRNHFNFFTMELNIKAMKKLTLINNLNHALEQDELFLHYQPIVDLKTRKIIGVEALLRWQHPKLGLIPPQEFIPVAEEAGLMLPIGNWVLATACAQNKLWQKQGLPPIRIAVNLTAKQLVQQNFVDKIAEILKETGLDPKYLDLEITESAIIEGSDKIIRIMQELKNIGIKLVIDDFGTGYSSLSYLNQLPIDKIKIDRSFISYISPKRSDVAVVLAVIAMARSLKMRSLAEGVETKEQLNFLRQNHCDEMQGYYFSRPKPAEKITKLLLERRTLEV